jgi:tetratricopeptide (TPR) repeat protein
MKYLLLILFLASSSFAYFQDFYISARAKGMGNAFSAVANDINTIGYNPSGLSFLESPQILMNYSRLHFNLYDKSNIFEGNLSISYPTMQGVFGFSWLGRGVTNLFREDSFIVCYGKEIYELIPNLFAGLSLKLLRIEQSPTIYTSYNTAIKNFSASNVSIDFGLLYRLENMKFSLSFLDFTSPRISLLDESNNVPSTIRLGFSYFLSEYNLLLALDQVYRNNDYRICLGGERPFGKYTLRIGVNFVLFKLSSFQIPEVSLGAGYSWTYDFGELILDYAFAYPLSGISSLGSHKFSLTMKLYTLALPKKPKPKPIVLEKIEFLPSPYVYTRPDLSIPEEINLLKQKLNEDPENIVLIHKVAFLLFIEGAYEESQNYYEKLIGTPYEFISLRALGKIRYEKQNMKYAYEEMRKVKPEEPEVLFSLGFLYLQNNQYKEALDTYKAWKRVAKIKDVGETYNLALSYIYNDQPIDAEKLLKEIINNYKARPVYESLGRCLFIQGKYSEAILPFLDAVNIKRDKNVLFNLGVAYYYAQKFKEAVANFESALQIDPEDKNIEFVLGKAKKALVQQYLNDAAVLESQRALNKALQLCKEVIKIEPENQEAKRRISSLQTQIQETLRKVSDKVKIALKEGRTEDAFMEWILVLEADPENAQAKSEIENMKPDVLEKGKEKLKEEKYEEAHHIFSIYLKAEPTNEVAKSSIELIIKTLIDKAKKFERLESFREAYETWEKLTKLEPANKEIQNEYNRIYKIIDEKANELFERAQKLQKDETQINIAIECIKKIQEMAPFWKKDEMEKYVSSLEREKDRIIRGYLVEARMAFSDGYYEKARNEAKKVLNIDPDNAEAKEILKKATEADIAGISRRIAEAKALDEKLDYDGALAKLDEILRLYPGNKQASDYKKLILSRLESAKKNQDEVKKLIEKADGIYDPRDPQMVKKAYEILKEALKLDWYNKEVRKRLRDWEPNLPK